MVRGRIVVVIVLGSYLDDLTVAGGRSARQSGCSLSLLSRRHDGGSALLRGISQVKEVGSATALMSGDSSDRTIAASLGGVAQLQTLCRREQEMQA